MQRLFPPRLELGTFRVLGERDNHYTTETLSTNRKLILYILVATLYVFYLINL